MESKEEILSFCLGVLSKWFRVGCWQALLGKARESSLFSINEIHHYLRFAICLLILCTSVATRESYNHALRQAKTQGDRVDAH